MPHLATDDNVKLYYEETGSGAPVVFVHEYAGDYRSWEPQVRHLAKRYRCITFNARGFPPSEVPQEVASYSQRRAADDIRAVLDALKIDKAHIVGLSMGGLATLHFGLAYPDRARSLLVAGAGYGSEKGEKEKFRNEAVIIAGQAREGGHGGVRGGLRLRPHPRAVREQGPARLCRVQGDAGRALGQGLGQHPARRAARAALGLRARGRGSPSSPCRCWS